MSRRAYHHHILDALKPVAKGEQKPTTLCGKIAHTWVTLAKDSKEATCPDCAHRFGRQELKRLAAAGTRIEAERLDLPEDEKWSLRSLYRASLDGTAYGEVVCESGYGKGWTLRDLDRNQVGAFPALEFALLALPGAIASGKLKSEAALEAARAEAEKAYRRQQQLRIEEREQRNRERTTILARRREIVYGLEELRERLGSELSNYETDALVGAIEMLKVAEAPKSESTED